jgi:hypothetical protein
MNWGLYDNYLIKRCEEFNIKDRRGIIDRAEEVG